MYYHNSSIFNNNAIYQLLPIYYYLNACHYNIIKLLCFVNGFLHSNFILIHLI